MAEWAGSTTAGLQVPVMPLVDVLGRTGTDPLSQIISPVPNGKVGTFLGLTTIVIDTVKPQVPGAGLKT